MATQKRTVDFILEQLETVGDVSARKMFGEYAIYCGAKVVALICDNQLFVKPTKAGKKFLVMLKRLRHTKVQNRATSSLAIFGKMQTGFLN